MHGETLKFTMKLHFYS